MRAILACALLGAAPALTLAEVVGVDIATRTDVQNGAAFGDAGAYELLTGRIRFAVDPKNARNQVIVDLDKAPRNAAGKVELSAEARLGAQRENPNDYWLTMRALLVAMDDWLRAGKAPPPSRYPQLANGTLVPAVKVAFPALPGVRAPQQLPAGPRAPNPLVAKDGGAGATLPFLVPQTDKDGVELAGVRLPDIEVPLATYTGWNFRNVSIGGEDTLYPLLGSYIPFPATAAARTAARDPRAAIAERYVSKQAYLDKIRAAADKLVADRFLLADDLPAVLDRAGRHWDLTTGGH